MKPTIFLFTILLFSGATLHAQVAEPDSVITAVYECISGPQGAELNWDRFRNLYHPDARIIPLTRNGGEGISPGIFTVEEFITRSTERRKTSGFWERELSRRVEVYDGMATVWSTYEGKLVNEKGETIIRGINSFQLIHDGGQWKILSITWLSETDFAPIPAHYLPHDPK